MEPWNALCVRIGRRKRDKTALGRVVERRHDRSTTNPLAGDGHMAEVRPQQLLELITIELSQVKLVPVSESVRIFATIGARDDQQSVRTQYPVDLPHHVLVTIDVLDRLEAHDHVDRSRS